MLSKTSVMGSVLEMHVKLTMIPDGQQLFVDFKTNYIIDDHLQCYLGKVWMRTRMILLLKSTWIGPSWIGATTFPHVFQGSSNSRTSFVLAISKGL